MSNRTMMKHSWNSSSIRPISSIKKTKHENTAIMTELYMSSILTAKCWTPDTRRTFKFKSRWRKRKGPRSPFPLQQRPTLSPSIFNSKWALLVLTRKEKSLAWSAATSASPPSPLKTNKKKIKTDHQKKPKRMTKPMTALPSNPESKPTTTPTLSSSASATSCTKC